MKDNGRVTPQEFANLHARALSNASIEIFPSESIGERTLKAFGGTGRKVAVTASSNSSLEKTLDLATYLKENGFDVMPHIAAQQVYDKGHAREIVGQLKKSGFTSAFFIKGDGERKGTYRTSAQLMRDMVDFGLTLDRVGIAGHPEGLPKMTEEQMIKGVGDRQEIAKEMGAELDIYTQMCFYGVAIVDYARRMRSRGITGNVIAGLAAPEVGEKLHETAVRCRAGDSKEGLLVYGKELYTADSLVKHILTLDPRAYVSGYHIYSFNKVNEVSNWLNQASSATS